MWVIFNQLGLQLETLSSQGWAETIANFLGLVLEPLGESITACSLPSLEVLSTSSTQQGEVLCPGEYYQSYSKQNVPWISWPFSSGDYLMVFHPPDPCPLPGQCASCA